jgi:hypothetical protein
MRFDTATDITVATFGVAAQGTVQCGFPTSADDTAGGEVLICVHPEVDGAEAVEPVDLAIPIRALRAAINRYDLGPDDGLDGDDDDDEVGGPFDVDDDEGALALSGRGVR